MVLRYTKFLSLFLYLSKFLTKEWYDCVLVMTFNDGSFSIFMSLSINLLKESKCNIQLYRIIQKTQQIHLEATVETEIETFNKKPSAEQWIVFTQCNVCESTAWYSLFLCVIELKKLLKTH